MSEKIGNDSNDLTITIPSSNQRDWGRSIKTMSFEDISTHNHRESGLGMTIVGYKALDLSEALLTNDTYLLSVDVAGTGTVSVLKVDTNDKIAFGAALASFQVEDAGLTVVDGSDNTKEMALQLSSISTATTRTITMADYDINLSNYATLTDTGTVGEITLTGSIIGLADNPIIPGTDSMVVPVSVGELRTPTSGFTYDLSDDTFRENIGTGDTGIWFGGTTIIGSTAGPITSYTVGDVTYHKDPAVQYTNGTYNWHGIYTTESTDEVRTPIDGSIRWNSTTDAFQGYVDGTWESFVIKNTNNVLNTKGQLTSYGASSAFTSSAGKDGTLVTADSSQPSGLKRSRTALMLSFLNSSQINSSTAQMENIVWTDIMYDPSDGVYIAISELFAGVAFFITHSHDGVIWSGKYPAYTSNFGRAMAHNNAGTCVIIGHDKCLSSTSPDTSTWTNRTIGTGSWESVCWSDTESLFVAVEWAGTGVQTSPDGITWTTRTSTVGEYWSDVVYGNGKFVACANNGGAGDWIMSSTDGITWTKRTQNEKNEMNSIAYGGGRYVIVSSTGTNRIQTSTDGITWTGIVAPVVGHWSSVIYAEGQGSAGGNGIFVAATNNDTTAKRMVSVDGLVWYQAPDQGDGVANKGARVNGIAFGKNEFVTVGQNASGNPVITKSIKI